MSSNSIIIRSFDFANKYEIPLTLGHTHFLSIPYSLSLTLSLSLSCSHSFCLFFYKLPYLIQILIYTLAYLICVWHLTLLTTKYFYILKLIDVLLWINVGEGLFQFVLIDNLENLFSGNIISNMPYLLLHLPYPKKCFSPKTFSGFFFFINHNCLPNFVSFYSVWVLLCFLFFLFYTVL